MSTAIAAIHQTICINCRREIFVAEVVHPINKSTLASHFDLRRLRLLGGCEQLVALLMEHGTAVKCATSDLFEIDYEALAMDGPKVEETL